MSDNGRFHVASGAVDVAFAPREDLQNKPTVFVSHVLVDLGEGLSTAESISLIYNSDEEDFQNIKVAKKDLAVGEDHATFEFATGLALNMASLQVLFPNTDDVVVRVVFIHDYR